MLIKNTLTSTIPSPEIQLRPLKWPLSFQQDLNTTTGPPLIDDNQTAPPAITKFTTIIKEEGQEGLIDAAEQEKDDCFQRIDNIQHALDNPVENNNNNTTYKRKQKHLCYLQTQE